jgi:hypothetical protein
MISLIQLLNEITVLNKNKIPVKAWKWDGKSFRFVNEKSHWVRVFHNEEDFNLIAQSIKKSYPEAILTIIRNPEAKYWYHPYYIITLPA